MEQSGYAALPLCNSVGASGEPQHEPSNNSDLTGTVPSSEGGTLTHRLSAHPPTVSHTSGNSRIVGEFYPQPVPDFSDLSSSSLSDGQQQHDAQREMNVVNRETDNLDDSDSPVELSSDDDSIEILDSGDDSDDDDTDDDDMDFDGDFEDDVDINVAAMSDDDEDTIPQVLDASSPAVEVDDSFLRDLEAESTVSHCIEHSAENHKTDVPMCEVEHVNMEDNANGESGAVGNKELKKNQEKRKGKRPSTQKGRGTDHPISSSEGSSTEQPVSKPLPKQKRKRKPKDGSLPQEETSTEQSVVKSSPKKRRKRKPKDGSSPDKKEKSPKKKKERVLKKRNERRNIREIMCDEKLSSAALEAQQLEIERQQRLKANMLTTVRRPSSEKPTIPRRSSSEKLPYSNISSVAEGDVPGPSGLTNQASVVEDTNYRLKAALGGQSFSDLCHQVDEKVGQPSVAFMGGFNGGLGSGSFPTQTGDFGLRASARPDTRLSPAALLTGLLTVPSASDTNQLYRSQFAAKQQSTHDADIICISSDEEEDSDCIVVSEDNEGMAEDDDDDDGDEGNGFENSGPHTDDRVNCADANGRVRINMTSASGEEPIYVQDHIASSIQPHQIGGLRFMYDNIIEEIHTYRRDGGFGCILAHCMGLGKTMQSVVFSDLFLAHTPARHVLILVPITTLQNWVHEFKLWRKDTVPEKGEVHYVLKESHKTMAARSKVIEGWRTRGGVLLLGYEMYILLTEKASKRMMSGIRSNKKKGHESKVIDVEEEEEQREIVAGFLEALRDPGPDMVICDEGHKIKNRGAQISKALKKIRTKRRVVLTGTPLQNNLKEYWCMVDFVREHFLGTEKAFSNMFERPIANGLCINSTAEDRTKMKMRAHLLNERLAGFVQRRNQSVLSKYLPSKSEMVLMVRMSPLQRQLYAAYMSNLHSGNTDPSAPVNPLKVFTNVRKIWNHPDVLKQSYDSSRGGRTLEVADSDSEDMDGFAGIQGKRRTYRRPGNNLLDNVLQDELNRPGSSANRSTASSPGCEMMGLGAGLGNPYSMGGGGEMGNPYSMGSGGEMGNPYSMGGAGELGGYNSYAVDSPSRYSGGSSSRAPRITDASGSSFDWAHDLMNDYRPKLLEDSGKFALAHTIIEESVRCGEKVLVFSQSLITLNRLEDVLQLFDAPSKVTESDKVLDDAEEKMHCDKCRSQLSESHPEVKVELNAGGFRNSAGPLGVNQKVDLDGGDLGFLKTDSKLKSSPQVKATSHTTLAEDGVEGHSNGVCTCGLERKPNGRGNKGKAGALLGQKWKKGTHYFRLDGSTAVPSRNGLTSRFNDEGNTDAMVFLVSTKAGGLGINLFGASVVIVMDVSWNPCHDVQAIYRAYRIGQKRPCHIYRLISDGTMERRIYDRQVTKLSMADRVVDKLNPQDVNKILDDEEALHHFEDKELPYIDLDQCRVLMTCNDPVLVRTLQKHHKWITQEPFTHESLLEDRTEGKLSRAEKREAKRLFEQEQATNNGRAFPSSSSSAQPSNSRPRDDFAQRKNNFIGSYKVSKQPLLSAPRLPSTDPYPYYGGYNNPQLNGGGPSGSYAGGYRVNPSGAYDRQHGGQGVGTAMGYGMGTSFGDRSSLGSAGFSGGLLGSDGLPGSGGFGSVPHSGGADANSWPHKPVNTPFYVGPHNDVPAQYMKLKRDMPIRRDGKPAHVLREGEIVLCTKPRGDSSACYVQTSDGHTLTVRRSTTQTSTAGRHPTVPSSSTVPNTMATNVMAPGVMTSGPMATQGMAAGLVGIEGTSGTSVPGRVGSYPGLIMPLTSQQSRLSSPQ